MKDLKISKDLFKPDLDSTLINILTRCLNQNKDQHYQDIKGLKGDLKDFLESNAQFATSAKLGELVVNPIRPRVKVKAMGSFLKKDKEGYLINESALEKISGPWVEPVQKVKNEYLEQLGDRIHSIYLRGSVGKGKGIEGISDIDTFAVLQGSKQKPDLSWIKDLRKKINNQYPHTNGVDVGFIFIEDLFQGMSLFSYRFIIKVLAACIHGNSLAGQIKPIKPTMKIAFFYHGNLREVLNEAIAHIESIEEPSAIQLWSNYALRRIIRLGFAINIDKKKEYTRDLFPCFKVFSEFYPEREAEMRIALELALNLPKRKEVILPFLKSFGGWLILESERVFAGRK